MLLGVVLIFVFLCPAGTRVSVRSREAACLHEFSCSGKPAGKSGPKPRVHHVPTRQLEAAGPLRHGRRRHAHLAAHLNDGEPTAEDLSSGTHNQVAP